MMTNVIRIHPEGNVNIWTKISVHAILVETFQLNISQSQSLFIVHGRGIGLQPGIHRKTHKETINTDRQQ